MIFNYLDGFSVNEQWGEAGMMNGFQLFAMHFIRKAFRELDPNATFVIHNGFDVGGHKEGSEHYKGNANDFHIETVIPYAEQISHMILILDDLQIADRVGLGIYPTWNRKGFHLDCRGKMARWGRIRDNYVNFDEAHMYARQLES